MLMMSTELFHQENGDNVYPSPQRESYHDAPSQIVLGKFSTPLNFMTKVAHCKSNTLQDDMQNNTTTVSCANDSALGNQFASVCKVFTWPSPEPSVTSV